MMDYPYSKGNLLEQPNTYFYTPFNGKTFLEAWVEDRRKVIESLPVGSKTPPSAGFVSIEEFVRQVKSGKIVETEKLLEALYKALCVDKTKMRTDTLLLLNKIVKRFEVYKRIHSAYGVGFKAVDRTVYRDLNLYVRTAEVFELAYSVFGEFTYLNVLLKILDTLCSISQHLSIEQRSRLASLISREKLHVQSLSANVGIQI